MFEWLLTGESLIAMGRGVLITCGLTLLTTTAAVTLGLLLGAFRLSKRAAVRIPSQIIIEVGRNIPALVHIIFWAFAFPNLFSTAQRQIIFFNNPFMDTLSMWTGLSLPYYALAAAIGLTLNSGGYIAELFRAGTGTIPAVRLEAIRLLGASERQLFRYVLLPEGVRAAFPAISTRLIHNLKNTSLAAFVAVPVFFKEIQGAVNLTFQATEIFLFAAAVYLILTWGLGQLLYRIETWLNRPRTSAPFQLQIQIQMEAASSGGKHE